MNEETKHFLYRPDTRRDKQASSSLLTELAQCPPEEALKRLETARSGLTEEEVEARQERYGRNE